MELPSGGSLVAAVAARHGEIGRAVAALDDVELVRGSRLPGWDRLTIVCHLRYGAAASERMTRDALAGVRSAYYPEGRDRQRPSTLRPDVSESPAGAVSSLVDGCQRLDELWAGIDGDQWTTEIHEPADNPDLGPITLWFLALLRLTEVEVHGEDLGLGLSPWSSTFVHTALPTRLQWLPTRRSNHRTSDRQIDGTWALVATDGPMFHVGAAGDRVEVDMVETAPPADATIVGSAREVLAFILGRAPLDSLEVRGDADHAGAFLAAFPAP